MSKLRTKVCVTGGSGYIGSYLVKKLLERGYTVHATLRNLEDKSKVGVLKSLPNAEKQLFLFQADIYDPDEFGAAIKGCEYVFHVATPLQHHPTSSTKYKDRIEATIAGARSIVDSCIQSQSVKRLIYTGTVMAASPLNGDGIGFKSSIIDESCWTPYDSPSLPYLNDFVLDYIKGKTIAEKELLSYNDKEGSHLDVVSLACALVGGDTLLSFVPGSVQCIISQLSRSTEEFNALCLLQELLGSVPLVHVDDVCEAHIFCMEKSSMKGRFLCAADSVTVREMTDYFKQNHADFKIDEKFMGDQEKRSKSCSSKLADSGFEYKYNLKEIMDESVLCGKRLECLS